MCSANTTSNTTLLTTHFLTLQDYVRQVGNNSILMDKIIQVDPNGNILWSWDTYNYIPLSEASRFNETAELPDEQVVEDFTHANSIDWDYTNGIIYLNLRVTNTFYAINQTTGNIIWACGRIRQLYPSGRKRSAASQRRRVASQLMVPQSRHQKKLPPTYSPCLTTTSTTTVTLMIATAK